MVADDEITAQAARILRELPSHPAARRFCFAGWDRRDYLRLDAQLCLSGTPTLRRVLPDESILVGPAALPARAAAADPAGRRSPPEARGVFCDPERSGPCGPALARVADPAPRRRFAQQACSSSSPRRPSRARARESFEQEREHEHDRHCPL